MIWLGVAVCVLVSFIFSGIEAGLLSMNRVRLKHRLKQRDRAAITLNRLLERPERLLVTVLVVTNLMNIFAITMATQEIVRRLGTAGYFAAGIVGLPIYLLGLELLPKSLFRRFPYRAVAALSRLLQLADLLLSPMHVAGAAVSRMLFGNRPATQQKLFVAREDFKYLTIESERVGTLSAEARRLIHNVVDFRSVTARDVMVPLEKVRTMPADAPIEELLAQSRATKIDRWPVVSDAGEIAGVTNVFDIALDERRDGTAEQFFQRRIVSVAADEPAFGIVRKMRAARITMVAVHETGGAQIGIVAWEDLIRRLLSTAPA